MVTEDNKATMIPRGLTFFHEARENYLRTRGHRFKPAHSQTLKDEEGFYLYPGTYYIQTIYDGGKLKE